MFKIILTKHQWQRFSEILGNLGLLTFASSVIPNLINELDLALAASGLLISFYFWYISLVAARRY